MARTPKSHPFEISTSWRTDHDRQLLQELARGDQEIIAGRGYDLDDVLADADRILSADPR